MYLFRYIGDKPNFGDELNAWLWPKLLPDFFDGEREKLFLGIGSVLFDSFPRNCTKVVCGAGFGGYTARPDVHQGDWDIYFVRGPITAKALGLPRNLALGDPAILVRQLLPLNRPKVTKFAYMPHVDSLALGAWREVCRLAGVRLIDPSAPVDTILREIQETEVLISEALHGAIVADALRTPWIGVLPLARINRMKWLDWEQATDFSISFQRMPRSSTREFLGETYIRHPRAVATIGQAAFGIAERVDAILLDRAARHLRLLTKMTPQLSVLSKIEGISEEMIRILRIVKNKYSRT